MKLRNHLSILDGVQSQTPSMQDVFAITMSQGKSGTYIEAEDSEVPLLNSFGWKRIEVSESLFMNGLKIDALFIDLGNVDKTVELLKSLFQKNWKFKTIVIRKGREHNQDRKLLHYEGYAAVAIEISDTWDYWCSPGEVPISLLQSYFYDGISVEEMMYDHTISETKKRVNRFDPELLETDLAKHFLKFE